ncbi:MAG TPA: hypothetical protein VEA16_22235, partial [Vicinamibacterales bacterium]|nr:hypothetical protein [Vicinamibacterales bacterium]
DAWLQVREVTAPSPHFTLRVMALIEKDRWQTERFVDLGFNLVIAAGVLVILAGGVGLAWSLGLLSLDVDLAAMFDLAADNLAGRVVPQMQTMIFAATLLTVALLLWWWAELDSSA